ncbi:RNA-binding protein [candidate division KSB1 bacterium]|nr:RNA-binding protein [candidate division KSB1 bacterium]
MNIYVGNLPRTATEESVRELFAEYGEVTEVKLLKDQYSGELRGFGFVTMPSKMDAQKAINEINGTEVEGRSLIVNEARPKGDSRSGGGGGGRQRGGGGRSHGGPRSRSW